MFIKSTNEFISSPEHVFDSIERHLGSEYADGIKNILNTVPKGYISNKELEELCDALIDEINNSKRLSRANIIKSIKDIYNTAI